MRAGHSLARPFPPYFSFPIPPILRTHTVWLRGYAPNGAGDSLYLQLDAQPPMTLTGFVPRQWSWANQTAKGQPVTLVISQAGLHTLRIQPREDGLRLDRLLLSTDGRFTPVGQGPPASGR